MANIRIKDLPSDSTPKQDDIVPIDLAGTRGTEIKSLVEAGRPTASKEEAEIGTDAHKAMTPLTTKQAIDAQVGAAYVPKTISVNAGSGLTGGGNLSGDLTVSLTQDNIDRLNKVDSVEEGATKNDTDERLRDRSTHTGEQGINTVSGLQDALDSKATTEQGKKADTALQAPGGLLGEILVKNSNTDNDVAWVASEAATAVSYGPQELTEDQQAQARDNISSQQTGMTLEALRKANGAGTNRLPYMTGVDSAAFTPLTDFARSILDDANGAAMWGTMGGATGGDAGTFWIKLPNEWILQAGSILSPLYDYRLVFPTAFTGRCLYVGFTNTYGQSDTRYIGVTTSNITVAGADVRVRDVVDGGLVRGLENAPLVWFAIGW